MLFFKALRVARLRNGVEIADWVHVRNKAFFGDLDTVTWHRVTAEWAHVDVSMADDVWCDPSFSLPSEVLRLPLPFTVLCSTGNWTSICVCDLKTEGHKRGGWRIGLRKHTGVANDGERRFPTACIPKDRGGLRALRVKDVEELNFYESEVRQICLCPVSWHSSPRINFALVFVTHMRTCADP